MGKRQHYVPQFYLRRFSEDGLMISFYKLSDGTYRKSVPIDSIMFEKRLYDDDDHIEDMLTKAESVWNHAIASQFEIMEEGEDGIERLASQVDERSQILHFVGCSLTRTSGSLAAMQGLTTAMVEDLKKSTPAFDPKKSDQFSRCDDRYSYVEVMLEIGEELAVYLLDLSWVYLINESGMPFITSDNPVSPIDTYYSVRGLRQGYGLGASGIQVFVPLSSDVCLVLLDGEVYDIVDDLSVLRVGDRSFIREINMVIAQNAFNYLAFSPRLAGCHVRGMAKRHRGTVHTRLGVYETSLGDSMYAFQHVRPNTKLLIPGIPIREDALRRPLPPNALGPRRAHTQTLDSIERSEKPEGLPDSFVARLKRYQTIL